MSLFKFIGIGILLCFSGHCFSQIESGDVFFYIKDNECSACQNSVLGNVVNSKLASQVYYLTDSATYKDLTYFEEYQLGQNLPDSLVVVDTRLLKKMEAAKSGLYGYSNGKVVAITGWDQLTLLWTLTNTHTYALSSKIPYSRFSYLYNTPDGLLLSDQSYGLMHLFKLDSTVIEGQMTFRANYSRSFESAYMAFHGDTLGQRAFLRGIAPLIMKYFPTPITFTGPVNNSEDILHTSHYFAVKKGQDTVVGDYHFLTESKHPYKDWKHINMRSLPLYYWPHQVSQPAM
ncbi:MAG: hypothetical protein M3Q97_05710 [Bacteroidota bacterium]|nr:hypothetical protein [Bacteroidota bacterium]